MKPFLFLGTRAEDDVADSEYAAVLRCAGLDERDVRRVRLERDPLGATSTSTTGPGIVLGGGPFNVSDPEDIKSAAQQRAEAELRDLAERVGRGRLPVPRRLLRRRRARRAARRPGRPDVRRADLGRRDHAHRGRRADPLLGALPPTFDAFLGHKEAVTRLPDGAVRLAGSATCPVQAFRLGRNVYATQFHPELDVDGLCLRIDVYRHHGYFDPPELAEEVQAMARTQHVEHPPRIIDGFVQRYAR